MVVWGQGPLLTLSCVDKAPYKCKKKRNILKNGGQKMCTTHCFLRECLIDSRALPATSDSHSRPAGQRSAEEVNTSCADKTGPKSQDAERLVSTLRAVMARPPMLFWQLCCVCDQSRQERSFIWSSGAAEELLHPALLRSTRRRW